MKTSAWTRALMFGAALWVAAPLAAAEQSAPVLGVSAAGAPMVAADRWRFTRSALAKPGKFLEAVQFAKEIVAYINGKYPQVTLRAYSEAFGNTGKIHWYSDWKDLASVEAFNADLATDKQYWSIVNKKAADVFVEDSVRDVLMSGL